MAKGTEPLEIWGFSRQTGSRRVWLEAWSLDWVETDEAGKEKTEREGSRMG